jgi:DNA-binding transcriptional MocR family regulator
MPQAERYIKLPEPLLAEEHLSLAAKLVMALLLSYRNPQTGRCNPKQITLARKLGMSRRTISRAITELRRAEWLVSKRGQSACAYEIQMRQNGASDETGMAHQMRQSGVSELSPPYMNLSCKELKGGAERRQSSSKQKTFNAPVPVVPRKSANSETLDAYYRLQREKAEREARRRAAAGGES